MFQAAAKGRYGVFGRAAVLTTERARILESLGYGTGPASAQPSSAPAPRASGRPNCAPSRRGCHRPRPPRDAASDPTPPTTPTQGPDAVIPLAPQFFACLFG